MIKIIFATLLLTLTTITYNIATPSNALALSEYGRKCDDNSDCVECRDTNNECSVCLSACWNMYGPAESTSTSEVSRDRTELCRIRRAKWCNAQCWDPDDKTNPDYVSTKPDCGDPRFPIAPDKDNKPWE